MNLVSRRNSALIFLGGILIWVSMYVYVPILPEYATNLGASVQQVGVISGVYGLLPIIICIPLGFFAGRKNRDRMYMVAGFALVTLSGAMFWLTNSVTWLILARAVAAAGSAWWVVISSAYAKYQPEDKEVKAQGVITAGSDIGKMIGCVLCMMLADSVGYKSTFAVATIAGAIGLVAMFGIERKGGDAITEGPTLRETFRLFGNRDLLVFALLATITQMVSFAIPVTFTPLAASSVGANDYDLSLIQLVYVAAVTVTCFFVGTKPYEKIGGINCLAISFALGAISCIPWFYNSLASIYVMQILSGCCYGITLSALAGYVIRAVALEYRSGAMGVFQTIYSVGVFAGPTITGWLETTLSFEGAYWVFVAMCAAAVILCYVLIPKKYNRLT